MAERTGTATDSRQIAAAIGYRAILALTPVSGLFLLMPTHFLRVAVPLLSLTSTALAQTPSHGQRRQLEDLLPAATYAVARCGGLQAMASAASAVPMAAVVNAFLAKLPPETRAAHLDRGLDQAAEQVREGLQQLNLSLADVRAVLDRPMLLAMGRLTLEGMGPSVALLVDSGVANPPLDRIAQGLERQLGQFGMTVRVEAGDVGGVPVRRLHLGEGAPSLFVGGVASTVVVTNSRGYLTEVGRVAAGQQPALSRAAVAGLERAAGELPAPALASLFVNLRSVVSMFDAHLPYEAAELGQALGLGALDSLYFGTTASQLGGCDVMHWGVPGSRAGLAKAIVGQPVDLALAKLCSANTVVFGASSFDVPAALDAWQRVLDLLPGGFGQQVRKELGRDLARELRHLGLQPAELETMLRAFGNQVGFALSLEKGAVPKPELLLRVAVREAAQVQPLLQRLEAMLAEEGLEWKERAVGSATIRFVSIPVELGEVQWQFSPCYVLRQGELLLGSDVPGMVRALRQAERPADSFAEQPDFAQLASECRGKSGVLHLRLFRAADLGWRTVEQLAFPLLDNHQAEIGFGSEALPDAEAMAQALGTSTFTFAVDDSGLLVKSHGTLAFGALLAAGGALADEVLKRAGSKIY